MITLARKLRVVDYFTLGWGTMVGVGWLVVMDDWLLRGGALGGFWDLPSAARCCFPLAMFTASWSRPCRTPSGEVAYTAKVFPRSISLRHRMDDGAGLLHRLSVGSCGCRKNCGYIFPGAGFDGGLSDRRPAGLLAPRDHRAGAYRASHAAQLSRHPPERHLPELDNLRNPRALSWCSSAWESARVRRTTFRLCSRMADLSPCCW